MKNQYNYHIRTASIEEVFVLAEKIPEFQSNPKPLSEYRKRLSEENSLILVAEQNLQLVGYKIGYDRYQDGSFYSWLGAVLPEYRKTGVATLLANEQEKRVRKKGFTSIKMKTLNRFKNMLLFALQRGFYITDFERREPIRESRIELEKQLE